ncbi:hypothetical protein PFNF135_04357 [Plasmodium falciparum NF135/5.C10]|uniref:Uncharacterized protein n=1 Tax=Plasmodium falciparum NF135/5.C10 TaxID=1036726 RepID=W4IDZ0_PLAFA|nr:hypothetical protein PFNF135_04357 [Plasmodium falciparum NF135/5.C10]
MTYKYYIFDKFFKGALCLINNSYKYYSKSLLIILIYKLLFIKKNCIQISIFYLSILKNKTALNVLFYKYIKKNTILSIYDKHNKKKENEPVFNLSCNC